MKLQDKTFFKQVVKPMINLSNILEETFVKDFRNGPRKIFTAAEMWNIQRRRRTIMIR